MKSKNWKHLFGITALALLLCASTPSGAGEFYYSGEVVDIDRAVDGFLWVQNATVNMFANAHIRSDGEYEGELWATSGSTVNIYGGKIDSILYVTSDYNTTPEAIVTVYGTDFAVDGVAVDPSITELFLQAQQLSGLYEDGTPFLYWVDCLLEENFYLTIRLGWLDSEPVIEPDIELAQSAYDLGDVEIGQSATEVVWIANKGNANLTIESVGWADGSSADFAITPFQLPLTVEPNSMAGVQVVFSPSVEGAASAVMQILSSDPNESLVEVYFAGAGIVPELTAAQQIDQIIAFYAASVNNGTIVGDGKGKSAKEKAKVIGQMLACADYLIDAGYDKYAVFILQVVDKKTDGKARPDDFIKGSAAAELNAKIIKLIETLQKQ